MIAYMDTFTKNVFTSFKGDPVKAAGRSETCFFFLCTLCINCIYMSGAEFDYLEVALAKFEDGPFFLGQFSQVSCETKPRLFNKIVLVIIHAVRDLGGCCFCSVYRKVSDLSEGSVQV